MLYIFGGLPGVGKTELSKFLAQHLSAAYIRIDTIEQNLRDAGLTDLYDEGYKIAFALALENLKNGVPVVSDSTNPVSESRSAWRNVADEASSHYLEIEVICSNLAEHQRRVESRSTDIPNLIPPSWESVTSREYEPWTTADYVLDTGNRSPEQSKQELLSFLRSRNQA